MPNSQEQHTQNLDPLEENIGQDASAVEPDDAGVYGVLKCYFYTPKRGDIWGAFSFLFNGTTGESMENVFWVTRALAGTSVDVNSPWQSLNKAIPKMGVYEKPLGDKLSALMLETFAANVRIELCRSIAPLEQLRVISDEICRQFERTTHCFLELKMAFERMSAQELANAGVLTKEAGEAVAEAERTKADEKSFAGTFINCLPVIDPVHGKPVSLIEPEDMIEVKMQGGVGAGDMIRKFLTSTNQDAIFPVERVDKSNPDKAYIFLNINEEIKGIITATKDIRLRVLNMNNTKKTSITINVDNLILLGVLVVAIAAIAFAIRFLLF